MNPDENTVEVEEVEAESVEASRPRTVTATRKAVAPFTSPEEYVIASIEAQRGDRDAVARITAAVAQEGLADNPGVVPTPIVGDLISKVYGERPIINSARRLPMPQSGKVFERPMIAQHTTVGKQSAEFVELASQAMSITSLSVTKATYGGAVEVSFQNRDWTDPAIMGIVIADLVREYAEQTEAAAAIALTTGATGSQDLTAAGDAAAVTSAIYDGAEKVHTAAGELPDTLYVSPDQWARLGKLADTTNRPLFPSLAPSNANGQMNAGSFASNPFGLRLVVSNHFGGPTMILGVSRLLEHFEQVGGQLSATNVSTLSTTVAYYGYAAELVTIGGGFVKMTLA